MKDKIKGKILLPAFLSFWSVFVVTLPMQVLRHHYHIEEDTFFFWVYGICNLVSSIGVHVIYRWIRTEFGGSHGEQTPGFEPEKTKLNAKIVELMMHRGVFGKKSKCPGL